MNYKFKELPFAYDAIEPYLDARTMEIHYSKHHKGYYDKFVDAVSKTEFNGLPIEEIFKQASKVPAAVRNNGGGYYNHELYWNCIGENGGGEPKGKLLEAINKQFGSFNEFKAQFENAAATRFGSGWAWLLVKSDNTLCVSSTGNQENPLWDTAECQGKPILTIDVWEHAYYLKYQNRRPDFIKEFWNVIDWEKVAKRYEEIVK
ncbi:MAG: superoxide dismutase [Bacteroidales bacterium]|jgi:Fe-Mn family superoxide dismutase